MSARDDDFARLAAEYAAADAAYLAAADLEAAAERAHTAARRASIAASDSQTDLWFALRKFAEPGEPRTFAVGDRVVVVGMSPGGGRFVRIEDYSPAPAVIGVAVTEGSP